MQEQSNRPTPEQSLKAAIERALIKEASVKGVDLSAPYRRTTYTALCSIAGKPHRIESTDLKNFEVAVRKFLSSFPHVPVSYYETEQTMVPAALSTNLTARR